MLKKKKSTLLTEEAAAITEENDVVFEDGEEEIVKPPKKPKGRKRGLGLVLMILAIISIVVVNPLLTHMQEKDYVTVYVAKTDIEKGVVLTKEMISEVSTPQSSAFNALVFAEDPVGKYAQTDIEANDIITKSTIGDTLPFDQEYLYQIPEGKEVLSVSLGNYAAGLSGYIQAGDVVRVYTYGGGSEANQPEELKYVKVLDVTYSSSEAKDNITTIILSVNKMQAQKLVSLENTSSIHLALINRFDSEKSEQLLKQQDALLESLASQKAKPENTEIKN